MHECFEQRERNPRPHAGRGEGSSHRAGTALETEAAMRPCNSWRNQFAYSKLST